MKNLNIPNGDALANEVEIDLDMLRVLMLDGAGGEVDRADVVAVDEGTPDEGAVQLLEELAEPAGLSHAVGHSAVLGLGTRAGDDRLPLGRPGDEVVTKEHSVSESGPTCVRATRPVSVGVDDKLGRRGSS